VAMLATAVVAAGLIVSAGSRPAVPAPFGPARNGVLLYRAMDGVVRSIDPGTGRVLAISGAFDRRGDPVPSRDGRRVAFVPVESGPGQVVVADLDGSAATTLVGEYRDVSAIDWSPDSTSLAIISDVRGIRAISILEADGTAARTLALGREVDQMWFLPDGRLALLAAREPGSACNLDTPFHIRSCDLFMVEATGTDLERVLDAPRFDGITIHPSPDGTKVVYVEWAEHAEGRLHVVDLLAGRDERLILRDIRPRDDYAINNAWFSPDGSSILFDLFEPAGDHWAIVPSTGGQVRKIGPAWPRDVEGAGTDASWSPDGRSVLAHYRSSDGTGELWILDATGQATDRRLDNVVPGLPAWQRTAD